MGQALQRKLKELNIFYIYKKNNVVKKFVKILSALAFVDKNHILSTFNEIKNLPTFPPILSEFYEYFFKTYVGVSARFPLHLWNVIDSYNYQVPKTNNAIEGWHNVFNSTFGTSKYSFILLIEKLKDEEEAIRQKLIRVKNSEVLYRKKKYVEMELKLERFIIENNSKYGIAYLFNLVDLIFY